MEDKKPVGAPTKFKAEYIEQAKKLALLGAIDTDVADFFGVDVATINRWKLAHAEFCESLKAGKLEADEQVKKSLFNRANGYSHPEDKIFCNKDGDTTIVPTEKHYAPDTVACIFWLKNRQPKDWRDKVHNDLSNEDGSLQLTTAEAAAKLHAIMANAEREKAQAETPALSDEDICE